MASYEFPVPKTPWWKRAGGGILSTAGNVLKYPIKHPLLSAAAYYGGDWALDKIGQGLDYIDAPVYPLGYGILDDETKYQTYPGEKAFLTRGELDTRPHLSDFDREANEYFMDSVDYDLDKMTNTYNYNQDDINKMYENVTTTEQQMYDELLNPVKTTTEPPAPKPPVEDVGLFGGLPIQEIYMMSQLLNNLQGSNTAPQIAAQAPRKGLSLAGYDEQKRKGLIA